MCIFVDVFSMAKKGEKSKKAKKFKGADAAEEVEQNNAVVRTVVVPSARLSYRTYRALAEVEREYSQMLRELVDFAYEHGITSFVKLRAAKYEELKDRHPDLPTHYIYTACRDAVTRVKSFLAMKEEGRAHTDKPQVRNVTVWLDEVLWRPEGYTAVKLSTKRGRVAIELRLHRQFWRYVNGGWVMSTDARFKLDHRRRVVYFYFIFRREVKPYEPRGFVSVDVNENNVTLLVDGAAYLLETDIRRITLGYAERRRRIQERNDGTFADVRRKNRAKNKLREGDVKRDIRRKIANLVVQAAYAKRYAIVLEELGDRPAEDMIKGVKSPRLRHRIYQAAFKGVQKAIEEKAREWGVPIVYVDPRNTSKLCPIHGVEIEYNYEARLGKCPIGGEVWHRDVAAVWNLLLRAWGDVGSALSPGPVGEAARGAVTPPPSAAHDPTRIPRAVWARRKPLAL